VLSPKKVKWRKVQCGKNRGRALRGNTLHKGDYGLAATTRGRITSRQIEAARIAINRKLKRGGTVSIRIFPDKPITKKPAEVRMGKGKGSPEYWVAQVKPGRILYEIGGAVDKDEAIRALKLAGYKLPIKTKVLTKENSPSGV
jgi:large subunit ribosomal protein L16